MYKGCILISNKYDVLFVHALNTVRSYNSLTRYFPSCSPREHWTAAPPRSHASYVLAPPRARKGRISTCGNEPYNIGRSVPSPRPTRWPWRRFSPSRIALQGETCRRTVVPFHSDSRRWPGRTRRRVGAPPAPPLFAGPQQTHLKECNIEVQCEDVRSQLGVTFQFSVYIFRYTEYYK